MTNPDVRRITLETLRKMIQKDRQQKSSVPYPVLYDISILDVSPELCLCPPCKSFAEKHGKSGLLIDYVNEIARKIVKEYPDIQIRTLAYSAAADLPRNIKPEKNVVIQICDQFPKSDAFRPLESKFNKETSAYLKSWGNVCHNLALWDYWNLGKTYFNPPRVETVIDAIIADMKFFKKNNFTSIFVESGYDLVSPQNFMALNYFVGSALMMNVDRDPEELINIFFKYYYGPCAGAVRDMFDDVRSGIAKHPTRKTILTAANWSHFTNELVLKHYTAIKKATADLPQDNIYRMRAETELITPLWASLIKRISFEPFFKKANLDMDKLKEECRGIIYRNWHSYFKFGNIKYLEQAFNKKFSRISKPVPMPSYFKSVPVELTRVLGWPQAFAPKQLDATIVDDPESESGKALKSFRPDPAQHGAKGVFIYREKQKFMATRFTLGNVGRPNPLRLHVKEFPSDEKYRWYKMPGIIDLDERSCFWGHGWAIQFDTTPLYVRSDGIADNNKYECYFHAKFTGPAYVPGSKKENAIYVDYVVLVRPGTVVGK
ncbi:MAG: DUF4838 domain-containing protein [Lentisphaeria bacterium]|nr:DUF4838 domain-containing protein [Lentisphaeria bacterium]